jgi:probable addiction module antidote protein
MSSYREDLLSDLKEPEYAVEYLSAARQESREAFLLALRDVADAQKGLKSVAVEAGVNRENLYRMLSEAGNPRLSSLDAVLGSLGIEYRFVAKVCATNAPKLESSPSGALAKLARQAVCSGPASSEAKNAVPQHYQLFSFNSTCYQSVPRRFEASVPNPGAASTNGIVAINPAEVTIHG